MNSGATSSPSADRSRFTVLKRPLVRWSLLLAVLLVLLMVAAGVWLPAWVQGRGMTLASEALGRRLSVEQVEVSPWRLGLVMRGLTLAGAAPADQAQLRIERVEARLSIASLWARAAVLSQLELQSPTLRLTRLDEIRLDIDDVLQRWLAPRSTGSASSTPVVLQRVTVRSGRWQFDDRHLSQQHELADIDIELPRLSLRAQDADEPVTLRVSARLDGAALRAELSGQPLAPARPLQLHLKIDGAQLAPWQAYAGRDLPLRLEQGLLDGDLQLRYRETMPAKPELSVAGSVVLRELSLGQRGQPGWLSWKLLRLSLRDVQPLARRAHLDAVEIEQPRLSLQRDRAGQLRLPALAAPAPSRQAGTSEPAGQLMLDRLSISDGRLAWQDQALGRPAALALDALQLSGSRLQWPLAQQMAGQLQASAQLRALPDGKPGQVQAAVRLDGQRLEAEGSWREISLQTLAPYLQSSVPLQLRGSAAGQWRFAAVAPLEPGALARGQLQLSGLSVDAVQAQLIGGSDFATLGRLSLDRAEIDLARRSAALGKLGLAAPTLHLRRNAGGELQLPLPARSADGTVSAQPWVLQLDELAVDKGRLLFSDAAVRPLQSRGGAAGPHQLQADAIQLRVASLALDGQGARAVAAPARLSLQLSQPGGRREGAAAGRISWEGRLASAPWGLQGALRVERLPLNAFAPYLDQSLRINVRRGEAAFKGQLNLELPARGWRGRLSGGLEVDELRLRHVREIDTQLQPGDEFLSWRELDLGGFDLALADGAVPQLQIGSASIADFYARLIVDERGHFNLGELRGRPAGAAAAPPEPAASAAASVAAGAAEAAPPALSLSIGETRFVGGTVDFSDRYIKPNYSAKLSELSGTLGRFASGDATMAPLQLNGRIEGTGRLAIYGQLNPSGAPLAMDINADASDIELSPLSPYAGKYAGYAIERGKLSSHVHYRIDPGGQLEAQNQIILNQLTFGERIESPSATKLPVLLAVALLKDRNGVIDINLPISGSLRDPQFSMGGLIVKIIVNLIGKALTAPFALLTGAGGAEQSQIDFAAGSAAIDGAALTRLDQIASALQDRPGLKLTLTGWAQTEAERAGLQAQALERALQSERRRELRRQGGTQAAAQTSDDLLLSAADRARLLGQLYKSSSLPDRPRNLLGLLKDLPAQEMEQRLLAGFEIKTEAVTQLALARAVALRDALISRGVPPERIFLGAPKLAEPVSGAPWVPKVELSLATH